MSKLRKRIDDDDEGHISESWLIPYADILTLLLALFIVLYASSSIDKDKYKSIMESFQSEFSGTNIPTDNAGLSVNPAIKEEVKTPKMKELAQEEGVDPELDELRKKIEKYLAENNLQSTVTLQETKRGIEISFQEMVLFDSGKAALKEESYKTLNGILGLIKDLLNPINFEGHTDNVPISNSTFSSNWELAAARAASVLYFFESQNIASERLQFSSYGEYSPIYANDSDEHRQANRRVTIVVLRK